MEWNDETVRAFFAGKTACCFTGHRPRMLPKESSPEGLALKARMAQTVRLAAEQGIRTFLAGGAKGFDTIAAEAVLGLKDDGHDVRLVLALPAEDQAASWAEADRARYASVLARADETHYAALTSNPQAMRKRNRYLAEHADCCVCFLSASSGGTFYTVGKALERGIPVLNLLTGDILRPGG